MTSNSGDEKSKYKDVFKDKAEAFYNAKIFDSAFYYYHHSKELAFANKDSAMVGYDLIKMAECQNVFGDYFGAESTLIEAIPYLKDNFDYTSALYNDFGIAAKELNNWEDARKNYLLAKKYSSTTIGKIAIDNNIGVVLTHERKYKEAIQLYRNILKSDTLQKKEHLTRKASILGNLGFALYKSGNSKLGLTYMQQGLQIKLQEKEIYKCIESYMHLAEFYEKDNTNIATQYALKAYQNASQLNSIDERLKSLLFLIKITPEKKYALRYAVLNDSINKVRNSAKNQFAKIKYDARKVNEENLQLKNKNIATDLQLQKSQNEKNIWISASALLISLLFIVYNYQKNRNKLEKQKATYFTETKIAKKIHDEIANDVFQTMAFVETKKIEEQENKETLIHLLDNLYQRSRNISKENESIETDESFIENLIEMINSYKSTAQNIIIKKDETIHWMNLSEIKKITLFRVVQELLVNMKKHSQAGIVVLNFTNNKKDITIDYSDNGKGMKIDNIKKSGIANVENRIQNINGKITFDATDNGLKVKINIPK